MNWTALLQIVGIVFGFLLAGAFTWFALTINSAPEGYEDEDGFHQL